MSMEINETIYSKYLAYWHHWSFSYVYIFKTLITVKSMDISSTEIRFSLLYIKNVRSNVKPLCITALVEQSGS